MQYFNKEQIEKLKDAEIYFNTIINHQFKRATTRVMNEMVKEVYEETTKEKIGKLNHFCGACINDLYRKAGTLYFQSIEKMKEEDITAELTEPINIPTTKKRGRKPSNKK